jgi:hypothetical protein
MKRLSLWPIAILAATLCLPLWAEGSRLAFLTAYRANRAAQIAGWPALHPQTPRRTVLAAQERAYRILLADDSPTIFTDISLGYQLERIEDR